MSSLRCFIVALLCAIFFLNTNSRAQSGLGGEVSFNFIFSPGSTILDANLGSNNVELANLRDFILHNKYGIQTGGAHFTIVSYIKEGSSSDLYSLNRASILGSIVRAYLKTRYGFVNTNFTFVIRSESELAEYVRIEYKPFSVKPTDNQDIYFTLKPSYGDLMLAMSKYRELPLEERDDQIETATLPAPLVVIIAPVDTLPPVDILPPVGTLPPVDTLRPADTTESPHKNIDYQIDLKRGFKPIFGLRTNLLNIAGVTPPAKVVKPLYNITMEFYYLKRSSIALEGYLSPLLNHKKTDSDAWHKLSGFSLEHRFWLSKPGLFKGLYMGLYGAFGEYDIMDPQQSEEGNTGNFIGGGLSIGFALPVSKRLLVEVGARGGYKRESNSSYLVIENSCYQTGSGNRGGIMLYDYNISLVYRLIGKQKGRQL